MQQSWRSHFRSTPIHTFGKFGEAACVRLGSRTPGSLLRGEKGVGLCRVVDQIVSIGHRVNSLSWNIWSPEIIGWSAKNDQPPSEVGGKQGVTDLQEMEGLYSTYVLVSRPTTMSDCSCEAHEERAAREPHPLAPSLRSGEGEPATYVCEQCFLFLMSNMILVTSPRM